jgi:hypothetical protein
MKPSPVKKGRGLVVFDAKGEMAAVCKRRKSDGVMTLNPFPIDHTRKRKAHARSR